MIVGILVKIHSRDRPDKSIRKTFKDPDSMVKYWQKMRKKYKNANFFAYKGTHPDIKLIPSNSESLRYCPYCECGRRFILLKEYRQCSICQIPINNFHVKLCNYGS